MQFVDRGRAFAARKRVRKAAVVLSGCGAFDGSEITEAVVTHLALLRNGAEVAFFAPDMPQLHTVDHLSGEVAAESRNVLRESARIARGRIKPLGEFRAGDFDILVFVGGLGAAENLCDFFPKGVACSVRDDVQKAVEGMLKLGKPMGFVCIAPVIAARAISDGVRITLGGRNDVVAAAAEKMGAVHVECPATSFVFDEKFNVYSTPAFMCAETALEVEKGIRKMAEAMLK